MLDGKVVSTELLSKDTYSAMTRIIRRGTKKTSSSNSNATTTTTQSTNTDQYFNIFIFNIGLNLYNRHKFDCNI